MKSAAGLLSTHDSVFILFYLFIYLFTCTEGWTIKQHTSLERQEKTDEKALGEKAARNSRLELDIIGKIQAVHLYSILF